MIISKLGCCVKPFKHFSPTFFIKYKVITGFNTDIIYEGITYHVQTEDKGLDTPLILSLIYNGGTILASKRSPYNDLLENFDENVLTERLQRQHKLICAAIKAGRIEDLKRMTMRESAAKKITKDAPIEIPLIEIVETSEPNTEKTGFETYIIPRELLKDLPAFQEENSDNLATKLETTDSYETIKPAEPKFLNENLPIETPSLPQFPPALLAFKEKSVLVDKSEQIFAEVSDPFVRETGKIPKPEVDLIFEVPQIVAEPVIEEVQIIEEEMILPAEAVVILSEYINQPPPSDNNKLTITLLNDLTLKGGDRKTLNISVHRGNEDFGLAKAHIIIKVLGSAFRPIIFHAKTDSNGIAVVHLQLPNFKTGRAVLLIRALYEGEETEIRRVVEQG